MMMIVTMMMITLMVALTASAQQCYFFIFCHLQVFITLSTNYLGQKGSIMFNTSIGLKSVRCCHLIFLECQKKKKKSNRSSQQPQQEGSDHKKKSPSFKKSFNLFTFLTFFWWQTHWGHDFHVFLLLCRHNE